MIDVSTLPENGLPQRHTVGTFDVCLARPKNCPAGSVRPHAAQLMIDRTVDHFCLYILAQCVLALIKLLVIAFQPDGGCMIFE